MGRPTKPGFTFFLIVAAILLLPDFSTGQDKIKIDSLLRSLNNATVDSVKINILVSLSKEYTLTDLSVALQYAETANEIADKTNDSHLMSIALLNIGNVYYNQGILELALSQYYKYLEIQRKEEKKKEIAYILINLGAINLSLENYEKAKKNFEESLKYFEDLPSGTLDWNRSTALLSNYNNLGIVYQNLKDQEKSAGYYSEGIKLARKTSGQEQLLAKLLNNIGTLYLQQGKMPEALDAINEALQIRQKSEDNIGLAQSYRTLSKYYSDAGKSGKSIDYLYKGLYKAMVVGNIPLQAEISEGLFDEYYKLGNADSALKYQLVLQDLKNKMNFEESKKEMTRLELTTQFNEREKQREIAQQKKEFRYIMLGLTLVLSLVIISLLFLISRYRLNRVKLEKDVINLASKNLELEKASLEKELELKNKELTANVMYLVQKNEFIAEIAQRVKSMSTEEPEKAIQLSGSLVADLARNTDDKIWKEFELRFQEVHQDFYRRLNEQFPGLTPNEKKLSAFLRLNMSTKDISTITFQSPDSIRIARSRLRKKLGLPSEDNLIAFLENI